MTSSHRAYNFKILQVNNPCCSPYISLYRYLPQCMMISLYLPPVLTSNLEIGTLTEHWNWQKLTLGISYFLFSIINLEFSSYWTGTITLGVDTVKFRYFIGYYLQSEPTKEPVLAISKWETHLTPVCLLFSNSYNLIIFIWICCLALCDAPSWSKQNGCMPGQSEWHFWLQWRTGAHKR